MATRNNRTTTESGLRAPEAQTFRALRVPHIPAQTISDPGGNARALAAALGNFSSALGAFTDQAAVDEKTRMAEARRRVSDFGNADPKTRHQAVLETGVDPAAKAMWDDNAIINKVLPKLTDDEAKRRDELNNNGWTREVQNPAAEEEGLETYTAPVTIDDLNAEREEMNRRIAATFTEPHQVKGRDALIDKNNSWYRERVLALSDYRNKESDTKADKVIADNIPAMVGQIVKDVDATDKDASAASLYKNSQRMAKEMNAYSAGDKQFITKSMLRGLERAAEDPNLAPKVMNILEGSPEKGVDPYIRHPAYKAVAERIYAEAHNTVSKSLAATQKQKELARLKGHIEKGGKIETAGIKDIEVQGATKKFSISAKEIESEFAKEKEAALITRNGVPLEMDENQQIEALAAGFARTGVVSPTLKSVMNGFSVGPNMNEQQYADTQRALLAFKSMDSYDPTNIDMYVDKDKDKVSQLRMLSALVDMETPEGLPKFDLKGAIARLAEFEGFTGDLPSKTFQKTFNKWEATKDARDLNPEEIKEVERQFNAMYFDERGLSEKDVTRKLEELTESYSARLVEINGEKVRKPDGELVVPPNTKAKLPDGTEVDISGTKLKLTAETFQDASEDILEKYSGPLKIDPNQVKMRRSGAGYWLIDKSTNLPLRAPAGMENQYEPIYLPDASIVTYIARETVKAQAAHEKKAQTRILRQNSYNNRLNTPQFDPTEFEFLSKTEEEIKRQYSRKLFKGSGYQLGQPVSVEDTLPREHTPKPSIIRDPKAPSEARSWYERQLKGEKPKR